MFWIWTPLKLNDKVFILWPTKVLVSKEFTYNMLVHLRSTEILAGLCWEHQLMAFKMRPKHHCLLHLALEVQCTKLNPKAYHVFADESFLGKIKAIARKCHGRSMQKRVLERWILSLSLFLRCDDWTVYPTCHAYILSLAELREKHSLATTFVWKRTVRKLGCC